MPLEKKKTIEEINFIKAVCALYITCFHFIAASRCQYKLLNYYINGLFGNCVVTCFFVASGALLYYHYSDRIELGKYYKKRFLGIFPMFWIAYSFFYINGVFASGDLFYHDQPWCLIFSLFGMDGYLWDLVPTYYYIGEWFLGAIIILYVLFPVLRWAFSKSAAATVAVLAIIYIVSLEKHIYLSPYFFRTVIACTASFTVGMLFMKYKSAFLESNVSLIVSVAFIVFTLFVYTGNVINEYFINQLDGWCLFVALFRIGRYAMKVDWMKKFFDFIGKLSYPIFLLHHRIIDRMLEYQNYSSFGLTMLMLLITVVLVVVSAWALSVVTKEAIRVFSKKKKEASGV